MPGAAEALAAKAAGIQHAIWSTFEDTRKTLADARVPTLQGKYKVPHFDAKGEAATRIQLMALSLVSTKPIETSCGPYDVAVSLAGKQPVRCNDTPGFIVNRILIPLLNDCVRVLDEADVQPEEMDRAMTNGAGWPMGPCALVDLIGIDVHVHASEALHGKLGEARMAPPERLVRMQQEGRLGRKSGRGFFEY